jgi:two-component system, OmpR family, response regulator
MGRKILVVEDDAETRAYVAKGLGELGHIVDQSADGRDGFFMASDGSYDLVILDRMLPAIDGMGVLMIGSRASKEDRTIISSSLLHFPNSRHAQTRYFAARTLVKVHNSKPGSV